MVWTGRSFRSLSARGDLPNLTRIATDGLAMPLRTLKPTSSPFLWNAIYSGVSPGLHLLRPVSFAPEFDVRIKDRDRYRVPDALDAIFDVLGTKTVRYPFAMWTSSMRWGST